MPDQIAIGNFSQGQTTNRLPFAIDNDAFPVLYNFYSWRGRVKRKRGTQFLGQLTKQISSVLSPTTPWQSPALTLVAGAGNLISTFNLESTSTISAGSISFVVGANTYTEPVPKDGTLVGVPAGSGTINYATGAITIAGGGGSSLTGTFAYYPGLPVMGLEDFISIPTNDSLYVLLSFDTKYSYQINQNQFPAKFYNTTYYKQTSVPFVWSGQDYQQFWTTNYSGALWATNNVPGLNFVTATYTSGSATTMVTFNFKSNGNNFTKLIVGDQVWFNEWNAGGVTGMNGIVGTVSTATDAVNGNYVVTFLVAPVVSSTGIAQLLTNTIPGQDGIKWYDGDQTSSTGIPVNSLLGWVNFAPPLTALSVSINNLTSGKYYLVGAVAILPFKDRLLFFSPWIQTSSGTAIQLQDTVLWSWNGTPYYNSLVPTNQTSSPQAYYVDQTGAGGYISSGTDQPIQTVSNNEDVLLVGFGGTGRKTRFVYTGDDLNPFIFFSINAELPSTSTFSSVVLDKGAIDLGNYGICITDQQSAQRIDLQIPDSVFQVQVPNNGQARVNAIRDYFKEWIYFSYPLEGSPWKFPVQTFLYNYRDNTWAVLYENFTAHGRYIITSNSNKFTWATCPFETWEAWNEPWNAGLTSSVGIASIVAGNPQGYVLIKSVATSEGRSGTIVSFLNNGGFTKINSPNHCLRDGDYIFIDNCIGLTALNKKIGRVSLIGTSNSSDANNFLVDLPLLLPPSNYLGLGTFARLSQPFLQTKQFPMYWEQGRQVRIGTQMYLFDKTSTGQVTLNIYLSQDAGTSWNDGPITPSNFVQNGSLEYSETVFTCPETDNLQTPTASTQQQIWHRMNTSLQGETFQIGITLNDAQMRNLEYATSEIALQGMQFTVYPGPMLA